MGTDRVFNPDGAPPTSSWVLWLGVAAFAGAAVRAALIGEVRPGPGQVILDTAFGGQRSLDELEDDPLPRIC